jgi:4a-hydroxytetrahydrobiopterin dehydratase
VTTLRDRHCRRQDGNPPLARDAAVRLLADIPGWELGPGGGEITRTWRFRNYYETLAFVNALAWIAHAEDHHPDLEVGYNRCRVRFRTHAVDGLSENDFICAARLNALHGE